MFRTPLLPTSFAVLSVVVAALGSGACRQTGVGPSGSSLPAVSPATGGDLPLDPATLAPGVPEIRTVSADQVGTDLHVHVAYGWREPNRDDSYDPHAPGGWSFQMFLDTDQLPTGYWRGYDYLTRDSEPDLAGRSVRVRRTTPGEDPGVDGWGEATALVPLRMSQSTFSFRVPLATIADGDGRIDYALEVYRTVECPACPDGHTHEYAYHLFGTSGVHGLALLRRGHGRGAHGHFARLAPSR